MASLFQSENPHPSAGKPATTTMVAISIVAALMVVMLLGIAAPRLFADATTNWLVALGAGVLTLVGGLLYGRWRRSGQPRAEEHDAP